MSRLTAEVFCEDAGFESFLEALVKRLAQESGTPLKVSVLSAQGGHSKVAAEVELFAKKIRVGRRPLPDIVVVGIDANCYGWQNRKAEMEKLMAGVPSDSVAIACAEPHIERWYIADPDSFYQVVGTRPSLPSQIKCGKDRYKDILRTSLTKAGHILTQGGYEFALEIVGSMDLYSACRNDRSLKDFVDRMGSALRFAWQGRHHG